VGGAIVAAPDGTLLGAVLVLLVSVSASAATLLLRQADASLTRIQVPELDVVESTARASSFLVVGSDSRAG
jgi:hypothetical protein